MKKDNVFEIIGWGSVIALAILVFVVYGPIVIKAIGEAVGAWHL